VFGIPTKTNNWASMGTFGERMVWLYMEMKDSDPEYLGWLRS
jgi:hypothetical protein